MKTALLALILAVGAGLVSAADMLQGRPFGASAGSPDVQAWEAERAAYTNVPGMERPKAFQDKVNYYNEKFHDLVSSKKGLKYHPIPKKSYKGATVASAITGSYGDINKFKAGIEAFAAEVKAMAKGSKNPKADAPNRFLVGQGWKIVKALASPFNDKLVPAANTLYQVSTKGNQNLEILISIAQSNGTQVLPPNGAKVAAAQSQLQLLNEVQMEHNAAKGQRQQASGPLNQARAEVPKIYGDIAKYDKKYVEYSNGMLHLRSDGAKLAEGALHGLTKAVTTAQAADSALQKAEVAEQKAIDAVRACTEGNLKAAQNPGDTGAQASAQDLNRKAIQEVEKANQARGEANQLLGSPTMPGTIAVGKGMEMQGSQEVDYRESDGLGSKAARTASRDGDKLKSSTRKVEAADQRP